MWQCELNIVTLYFYRNQGHKNRLPTIHMNIKLRSMN